MSVFEGIEHVSAEGTSNRQYFEEGQYLVTVESVYIHEKRFGGGKLFIVETTVDESNNPNIKPGEQRNWVQLVSLYSLPRIKAFIGSALGLTNAREINARIDKDVCHDVVEAKKNPLKGKQLALDCVNKKTEAGKEFTKATWRVLHG